MKNLFTLLLFLLALRLEPVQAQSKGFKMEPPSWMLVTKFGMGDAPYTATRKNLEARFRQGRSPVAALKTYLSKARKGDTRSLFAAGVCAYENDKRSQQEVQLQRRRRMEEVLQLIDDNQKWPTNYECVRLSFLLEQGAGGRFWLRHQVSNIAWLLLKRQPNDLDVEKEHGWLLAITGDLVPTEQAQNYFHRMIRKYPNQSSTFKSMLATSYQFNRKKDPIAVDKELALRREALIADRKLPLTPRVQENIANGELLIRLAERYKARQ